LRRKERERWEAWQKLRRKERERGGKLGSTEKREGEAWVTQHRLSRGGSHPPFSLEIVVIIKLAVIKRRHLEVL